jgi:hypothetical protein
MPRIRFLLWFFPAVLLFAQEKKAPENVDSREAMQRIQQRLDALEQENRQLLQEVRDLRKDLDASRGASHNLDSSRGTSPSTGAQPAPGEVNATTPPVDDRVAVVEARTAEQAQSKVEASQKFPISLNGMLLFNVFSNSHLPSNPGAAYELLSGPSRAGATVTQSLLGLNFTGPQLPGGGRVNGSLTMDFFGAYTTGGFMQTERNVFRIREADISFDWKNRTISVGQYKPLIAPLSPSSLAEVAIPPLSGAGNLWLWVPQVRYEERIHLNTDNGITAQGALLQTNEQYAAIPAEYSNSLAGSRPALEGRFAFWHKFDDVRKFEIGSGFHVSSTHVYGATVPSRIASVDWSITPLSKLQFTGTFYHGQNVASLGSLGNGFTFGRYDTVHAVHTSAGWAQVSLPVTKRLTFNVFGGLEDDSGGTGVVRNWTYASNAMYHLGPNVVVSFEALQMRAKYLSGSHLVVDHYDLGVAYLF